MTIKLHDGNWLLNGTDNIANECCCGDSITACYNTDCGDEPSMLITIMADDVDLPITWCGKTWVKSGDSGFHSGEPQCICPNFYVLSTSGCPSTYANAREVWANVAGLVLARSFYGNTQANSLIIRGAIPTISDYYRNISMGVSTILITSLGVLSTAILKQRATCASYQLTSAWFSSYTVGGVEYSWARGVGWP